MKKRKSATRLLKRKKAKKQEVKIPPKKEKQLRNRKRS